LGVRLSASRRKKIGERVKIDFNYIPQVFYSFKEKTYDSLTPQQKVICVVALAALVGLAILMKQANERNRHSMGQAHQPNVDRILNQGRNLENGIRNQGRNLENGIRNLGRNFENGIQNLQNQLDQI
jgi:uncharacterized protein with PQ loop repeat